MCITCILNVLMPLYMFVQSLCKSWPSLYGRIYALSNMINANDIKLTAAPRNAKSTGRFRYTLYASHTRANCRIVSNS